MDCQQNSTFKNTLSVYSQVSSGSTDFSSYYDMKLVSGISRLDIELKGQSALKLLANIEEEYLSFIFSKL